MIGNLIDDLKKELAINREFCQNYGLKEICFLTDPSLIKRETVQEIHKVNLLYGKKILTLYLRTPDYGRYPTVQEAVDAFIYNAPYAEPLINEILAEIGQEVEAS